MKLLQLPIKIFLILAWSVLAVAPARSQTRNMSDITLPNPDAMVTDTNSEEVNDVQGDGGDANQAPAETPNEEVTNGEDAPAETPTEEVTNGEDAPAETPTEEVINGEDAPAETPTEEVTNGEDAPAETPTEEVTNGEDAPSETPVEEAIMDETETPIEEVTTGETETPTEEVTTGETETPTEEGTTGETETPTEEETTSEEESMREEEMETSTEEVTNGETEVPTEEITNGETEAPTDEVTDGETEVPTDEVTDGEIEVPTDEVTDGETEVPTDEVTNGETEADSGAVTTEESGIPSVVEEIPNTNVEASSETIDVEATEANLEALESEPAAAPEENATSDIVDAPEGEVEVETSSEPTNIDTTTEAENTDNTTVESQSDEIEVNSSSEEQTNAETNDVSAEEVESNIEGNSEAATTETVEETTGVEAQETIETEAQGTNEAVEKTTETEAQETTEVVEETAETEVEEETTEVEAQEEAEAEETTEEKVAEEEEAAQEESSEAGVAQLDRVAYETQFQEAAPDVAIQMQEELQLNQLIGSSGLEIYGTVPSVQDISTRLAQLAEQTGKKPAFINVSLQSDQLESFVVLPDESKIASAKGSVVSSNDLESLDLSPKQQEMTVRRTVKDTSRKDLIATATQFRDEVSNARNLKETGYLQSSQELYRVLIEPIEAELEANDIDILVFSMDSGLRLLPVAALHDGEQFLVEKYAMATVPSFGLTDTRYVNLQESQILAMGASEFTEQNPLPTMPLELETILRNPRQGESFLNEQFTISNFKVQNSRETSFPIIHLGTHAEFKAGDLNDSYIQFYDDKLGIPELQELSKELGWNSDATPVELLVLSACQTAFGDEDAELGFAGLAVQAGVKSALASLWYVSDLGTLALMGEFYDQLDSTLLKAEALRQTQLAMLQGNVQVNNGAVNLSNGESLTLPEEFPDGNLPLDHPYFWSSFTLIGNWN